MLTCSPSTRTFAASLSTVTPAESRSPASPIRNTTSRPAGTEPTSSTLASSVRTLVLGALAASSSSQSESLPSDSRAYAGARALIVGLSMSILWCWAEASDAHARTDAALSDFADLQPDSRLLFGSKTLALPLLAALSRPHLLQLHHFRPRTGIAAIRRSERSHEPSHP